MFVYKSLINKSRFAHFLKMNVFTQKLNPITGQSDWIVQNKDYDYHQEVARSAFADMLHDTERNKKYELAIVAAVKHMHSKGKKANVLDIGTGTGLLSMMAVRAGADSVVACESFEPISECADKVIKLNGFADRITVITKRSTDLTFGEDGDLKFKANILVTEVFDTELIGEGALNTFKRAHEELLESDCIVIPQSATMYAEIVESPFVQNWNKLKDVYSEDGECLLRVPESVKKCPGATAVHDVQLSQLPLEYFNTIVSPQPVLRFDWSGKSPFVYENFIVNTFNAERDGTAHAVFMWWELSMDFQNTIVLSCAPIWSHSDRRNNEIPWRDHWMQAIYYLPNEVKVWKGENVNLVSCHDEFSVWFSLGKNLEATDPGYLRPFCVCNLHSAFPRTRIGQLNDGTRSKKYIALLEKHVNKDSVVLILSNGFYPGLVAEKLGAKKVICVESRILSREFLKSFVEFNELSNVIIVESADHLKKLGFSEKINLIFGEPYFTTSILPWDNLLFVYLIKEFKSFCDPDVKVFPKRAVVKGVAVEFKDLHKIRAALGTCEGFDMTPFDELIEASCSISDDNVEAQPLWEYPAKALSEQAEIAVLNLETLASQENIENEGIFKLKGSGKCNGIALWVDWEMEDDPKIIVSTGPVVPIDVGEMISWDMHVRQGVHLINNECYQSEINYRFKFDCHLGNISFKISQ